MNRITRTEKPVCLVKNEAKWTKAFIEKIKTNKEWDWNQYNNVKVNLILMPDLEKMTNSHCSYCGNYPLKQDVGSRSIDHFKPKSIFQDLAFEWSNLFMACGNCQSIKGSEYPAIEPLKFDEDYYTFDYWFTIDFDTKELKPNPTKTDEEQQRARATINWLGLNNGDRPEARADMIEKIQKKYKSIFDDFSDEPYTAFLKYYFKNV